MKELWFPLETTDLKAIHNWLEGRDRPLWAVISTGNYWFESNSQPLIWGACCFWRCDFHWKLLIWKQFTTPDFNFLTVKRLWFPLETTDLKAIHNWYPYAPQLCEAVISTGNYWFESNSQPRASEHFMDWGCDFHWKLLIWKQFTTTYQTIAFAPVLWFPLETTDLKAIHNRCTSLITIGTAVISTGNYWFESNSQQISLNIIVFEAVISTGNYWFESNSQHGDSSINYLNAVISTGNYWFESNSQL